MLLRLVACEIAFREICFVAARAKSLLHLTFLPQGYHDNPDLGRERLQQELDATEPNRYEAILVGYGLCNYLLRGLRAPEHTPLVVPRAHDCITFFLGSKERYEEVFRRHPGAYYYTSGWLEHQRRSGERVPHRPTSGLKRSTYEEWVAQYGEDNARYLMEFLSQWEHRYTHGVWIRFDFLEGLGFEEQVKAICQRRGWQFEELQGDLGLLQRWVDGDWDEEDFLIVPPGRRIVPTYDARIIAAL